MHNPHTLDRITTIRFRVDATVDQVVARLLESVRRTEISVLTLEADGQTVYPLGSKSAPASASSWRADMLWTDAPLDVALHLEVFLKRAELFLDPFPPGIHVVDATVPGQGQGERRRRGGGAYGLDGSFLTSAP